MMSFVLLNWAHSLSQTSSSGRFIKYSKSTFEIKKNKLVNRTNKLPDHEWLLNQISLLDAGN